MWIIIVKGKKNNTFHYTNPKYYGVTMHLYLLWKVLWELFFIMALLCTSIYCEIFDISVSLVEATIWKWKEHETYRLKMKMLAILKNIQFWN